MYTNAQQALIDGFFSSWEAVLTSTEDPVKSIGVEMALPRYLQGSLDSLLECALIQFQSQSPLLKVSAPVCIVGDIHGNLQDLVRILRTQGLNSSYLFLGDYVDRGQFSLECITLLLTLTCKYPTRFFLLRGNHECQSIASRYGFKDELSTLYGADLFDHFIEVFCWMPLAAIVNDSIFCVHGGIGPGFYEISQINEIERPAHITPNEFLPPMLVWSDPSETFPMFCESKRSAGFQYGQRALQRFLRDNNLCELIRGHQPVDGVVKCATLPVTTVFSSSGYDLQRRNRCGILVVDEAGKKFPKIFNDTVEVTLRENATIFVAMRPRSSSHIPPRKTMSDVVIKSLQLLKFASMGGSQMTTLVRRTNRMAPPVCCVQPSFGKMDTISEPSC
jgi:diadenosine tetraphosphatase ApaH/serine/threonine PP2A family protein phosphatase